MNSPLAFIPLLTLLLIVPSIYGLIIKLSARILKNDGVTWKSGFLFGLIVIIILLLVRVVLHFSGLSMPVILAFAVSLIINLLVGGWFFSEKAKNSTGENVGWIGGIKLSGISYGILAVIGIILTIVPKMLSANILP